MLKIGIPAQNQPEGKFGVNSNYLEFIARFGHPIIITPIDSKDFLEAYGHLDVFLLPGGQDINPLRYKENPSYLTQPPNTFLEYFDVQILPIIFGKFPIMGICRGLQTLNVFCGGTLHQNLWSHPNSLYEDSMAHDVTIGKDKDNKDINYKVNGFHHQGINVLGAGLKIEAKYRGLAEAISDFKNKVFAVQWHPERMEEDCFSINNFRKLFV